MNHYLRLVDQPMHIRFEFRKDRTKLSKSILAQAPGGEAPPETPGRLYVTLTLSKAYGPYATHITTLKGIWDNRHSPRPTQLIRELNRQKNDVQIALEEAHAELTRINRDSATKLVLDGPSIMQAYEKMKTGHLSPITLLEVYHEFLSWKKSLIEPNRRIRKEGQISLGTFKTYSKRWVLIQQFLLLSKQPKIPVQNVTYRTATELKEWMVKVSSARAHARPYHTATISKVIKLLKMLLTYAQSKDYVGANILATFTMPSGSRANPKPLSRAQMNLLETCELPPVLRHQCDSWLVAAELCLHYADYMELPDMKIVRGESGNEYIQHNRAKQTGTALMQTVNITPRAARILQKYGGPRGLYYGSSAYFSKQLKRIAKLAGLKDEEGEIIPLAFGQGRDTGLTRRGVQGANGMAIARLGGWSNTDPARYYIGDAVGIVDGFASGIRDEETD